MTFPRLEGQFCRAIDDARMQYCYDCKSIFGTPKEAMEGLKRFAANVALRKAVCCRHSREETQRAFRPAKRARRDGVESSADRYAKHGQGLCNNVRCRSGFRYIEHPRRAQWLCIAPPTDRGNGHAPGGRADLLRPVVETHPNTIGTTRSQIPTATSTTQTSTMSRPNLFGRERIGVPPRRAQCGGRPSQLDNT